MSKLIKRKQIDLKLKSAPDGTYGFSSNIPNILAGDEMEAAFDKIATVLDKLAPALPPFLNALGALSKTNSGTTTAPTTGNLTTDGTTKTNIHRFANGATLTWTTNGGTQPALNRSGHFRDGGSTTAKLRLTHTYDSVVRTVEITDPLSTYAVGNNVATANDNTGYNLAITVTEKRDYYSDDTASATKSNFYFSVKAAIVATMATTNNEADTLERTVLLEYSENGSFTDTISLSGNYRVEAATSPTSSTPTLTIPSMTGYISGVPSLVNGNTITIASTISNGIKYYYPTTIGNSTVTGTAAGSNSISGILTPNSTHSYSANHNITSGQHSESIAGTVTPRDIFGTGTVANATTDTTKRVDTISLLKASGDATSRKLSPASGGQFDAISATAYDVSAHANTLNPGSTDEYSYQLQLLTSSGVARYRYPTGNYSAHGGPNYTTLTQNSWRYADFTLGSLTNRTNCILTLVGASGIAEKFGTANLRVYIKVGTTGWLDANAAWGSGTPTADGDAAVDAGSGNTNTTGARQITFGATISGTVNVRIGINSGSSITFTGVTVA